jgi:hypothetical protein
MIKTPGEQLAASVKIVFPEEDAESLSSLTRTDIEFSDGNGGTVRMTPAPDLCKGTVVPDKNGNLTIAEALTAPSSIGAYDVVQGGDFDWACVLSSSVEYKGGNKMQVTQTILFWGDINWSRL